MTSFVRTLMSMDLEWWLTGLALGALVFVIFAAAVAYGIYRRVTCNYPVQALVVGIDVRMSIHRDDEGEERRSKSYAPIVRYQYEGQVYERAASKYRSTCGYREGQKITIRINPKHPRTFRIPMTIRQILAQLFVVFLGLAAIVAVSIFLLKIG